METHCRVSWIQSTYLPNWNVLGSGFNVLGVLSVTSPSSHPLLPPPKFSPCLTLAVIHQPSQTPPTTTGGIPLLTLRLCPSVFTASVCMLCPCLVTCGVPDRSADSNVLTRASVCVVSWRQLSVGFLNVTFCCNLNYFSRILANLSRFSANWQISVVWDREAIEKLWQVIFL